MKKSHLILPAAGTGSRLKSDLPKLFTELHNHHSLFDLILLQATGQFDSMVLILSPEGAHYYQNNVKPKEIDLQIVIQHNPTGMFDAIHMALEALSPSTDARIILQWGDQPFVKSQLYRQLLHDLDQKSCSIPLIWEKNPYVQFLPANGSLKIRESREGDLCDPRGFKDMGIFAFRANELRKEMNSYAKQGTKVGKKTKERSFLQLLPLFITHNDVHWRLDQPSYMGAGVNTPDELEQAQHLYKQLQTFQDFFS